MTHSAPGRRTALLLLLPLLFAAGACGAGGGNDAQKSGAASASDASVARVAMPADLAKETTGTDEHVKTEAPMTRAVISTGSLAVSSRRLDGVRRDAIALVEGMSGTVANEDSGSDSHGRLDSVDLTLRVPAASFESAMDGLARLGTLHHRQQSAQDVTTQVIDTDARVKAKAASVASLRALLAKARTIGQIMSIEGELGSRQAELDSLKQQQKWLADQTSMSTINLTLQRPEAVPVAAHTGFLGGLEDGWHALAGSGLVLLTVAGALLPFAALLALVGLPLWLVWRRRRSPAPAAS